MSSSSLIYNNMDQIHIDDNMGQIPIDDNMNHISINDDDCAYIDATHEALEDLKARLAKMEALLFPTGPMPKKAVVEGPNYNNNPAVLVNHAFAVIPVFPLT